MFDYVNENEIVDNLQPYSDFAKEILNNHKIKSISPLFWSDHCLECSAPLCYKNCSLFEKNRYGRCKRTKFDIESFYFNKIQATRIVFKKWSKIRCPYNNILKFKFDTFVKQFALYKKRQKSLFNLSKIANIFGDRFKDLFARLYHHGYIKKFLTKSNGDNYLQKKLMLTFYSNSDSNYNLILDSLDEKNVLIQRNSFSVKKGKNIWLIDTDKLSEPNKRICALELYPENDFEADIVFFNSDLVTLDKEGINKTPEYAKKVKCVVWDLDNTIWDGTLIETDANSLKLRAGIFEVIKELDQRGIIQVVVSKNNIDDVVPQLERLGIKDYFVYVVANWNAKSRNIISIANNLNLNVNSFAFIDDSSFERGEVKENISSIRIYDEKSITELLDYEEFNVPVTEDAKNRRIMYQIEAKRKDIQNNYDGNNEDFLRDCKLVISIEKLSNFTYDRTLELLQRTNQLNLSGYRYTKDEFINSYGNNSENAFVLFCHDKFGEYGQVGFFAVKKDGNKAIVSEYVMSCRVAQKYLEPAILNWIFNKYEVETIIFEGVDSKKNGLLINTLLSFGMINKPSNDYSLRLIMNKKDLRSFDIVSVAFEGNK